jgi:hypothetical protein
LGTIFVSEKAKEEHMQAHFNRRTIIQSAIVDIAALLFIFIFRNIIAGIILFAISTIFLTFSLINRQFAGFMEKAQDVVIKAVSTLVTFLLLVPFYYLCFVPGRIVGLLLGKDPLERKFPTNETTYWHPYSGSIDPEHWKRQF